MYATVRITVIVSESEGHYYDEKKGEREHDFTLPPEVAQTLDFNKLFAVMLAGAIEDFDEKQKQE